MSFFCCIGNHQAQPGERSVRIVVEWREKEYAPRENAHRCPRGNYKLPQRVEEGRNVSDRVRNGDDSQPRALVSHRKVVVRHTPRNLPKRHQAGMHDKGGKGLEVAREVLACASCANSLTQSA